MELLLNEKENLVGECTAACPWVVDPLKYHINIKESGKPYLNEGLIEVILPTVVLQILYSNYI